MKKRIFKINCTICRTGEKTYGFVKAFSEDTAKIMFTSEVSSLHGSITITQVTEVSEKEYKRVMKEALK